MELLGSGNYSLERKQLAAGYSLSLPEMPLKRKEGREEGRKEGRKEGMEKGKKEGRMEGRKGGRKMS